MQDVLTARDVELLHDGTGKLRTTRILDELRSAAGGVNRSQAEKARREAKKAKLPDCEPPVPSLPPQPGAGWMLDVTDSDSDSDLGDAFNGTMKSGRMRPRRIR